MFVGFDGEGLVIGGDRLLGSADGTEGIAFVIQRFVVVGFDGEGLVIGGDRLLGSADGTEGIAFTVEQ